MSLSPKYMTYSPSIRVVRIAPDLLHGLSTPRVTKSPHLGYVTSANYERFYTEVVAGITGFLNGSPVNVID